MHFGGHRVRPAERLDTTLGAIRYDIFDVVAVTLGAHTLRIEEAQDYVLARQLLIRPVAAAVALSYLREGGAEGNVVLAFGQAFPGVHFCRIFFGVAQNAD